MEIAVVGGYGLGVSFFVDRAPAAGETVGGARLLQTPGGKGSNQSIGARRLGASAALLTAIGPDDPGRLGLALWQAEGVDAGGVVELAGSTMVGAIITDASGENRIVIADGVLADYGPAHVDAAAGVIADASVVLVSLEVALPAAARALALGREAGATTILNPAPAPAAAAIDWRAVDIVAPNQTEAARLLGAGSVGPMEAARALRERFHVSVVLTLGGDGVLVAPLAGGIEMIAAPAPDTVVDTTGAGDAFNAGLAVGLLRGLDLTDAARVGAACGSLAVRAAGVIPSLPTRDAVVGLLRQIGQSASAAALA